MPTLRELGTSARLLLRGLRYRTLLPYAAVGGDLSVDAAIALYEAARAVNTPAPVAVVIGCWQGRSSVVIGKGLQHRTGATICCVDPFDLHGAFDQGQRTRFARNLVDAGVRDLVDVRQGHSHDVALEFRRPIDLLLLDGDRTLETLLGDFRDWAPKVRSGGCLCARASGDVGSALAQALARDGGWRQPRAVGDLLLAQKHGGRGAEA